MMAPDAEADSFGQAFDLERFVAAQQGVYATALGELRAGHKRTHWMWFIFPQLIGLGSSAMARRYAIHSLQEARAYLHHPVLGARLVACTEAVLAAPVHAVAEIFGYPDDLKFHASMTLFACASDDEPLFARALERFFGGQRHAETLALLRASTHA